MQQRCRGGAEVLIRCRVCVEYMQRFSSRDDCVEVIIVDHCAGAEVQQRWQRVVQRFRVLQQRLSRGLQRFRVKERCNEVQRCRDAEVQGIQRCRGANQVKGAEVVQWWRGAVVLNLQTW